MGFARYISKQFRNPWGIGGKLIFSVMNRHNIPLYNETSQLLALSNADRVLDIGCGNGYVLNMLAKQYECKFTGIDISPSIIENASKRCHRFVKSNRISLHCQNASSMSFADNSFEKIYTINTVYFWKNIDDTMLEIWRVLNLNGVFINTLFSNETLSAFPHTKYGYKRFTVEELKSAGSNLGFSVNVIPILNDAAYCILYHKISGEKH